MLFYIGIRKLSSERSQYISQRISVRRITHLKEEGNTFNYDFPDLTAVAALLDLWWQWGKG